MDDNEMDEILDHYEDEFRDLCETIMMFGGMLMTAKDLFGDVKISYVLDHIDEVMAKTVDIAQEDEEELTLEEEFNVRRNEMQIEEEVAKLRAELKEFLQNREDEE